MIRSIFTPKIKIKIIVYTEGITNLGENLTPKFLYLEVRLQIVFNTGETMKGADFKYVILISVEGTEVPQLPFENI